MMDVQLFPRLQAIEHEVLTLQRERHALLSSCVGVDGLGELQAERRTLIQQLREARERYLDLEWQLDEDALRIKVLAEQDREGPADLLIVRELVALRKRTTQCEEEALWQLERIGEMEAQLKFADATIDDIRQQQLRAAEMEDAIIVSLCCR